MTILYFTATGNSLYVAKSLGGEILSIPQMIKQGKYDFEDDKIGIVFPLYSWSVNSFVEKFIRKAKFKTNYLFAITTYGVYSGGMASHLLEIANECGHNFAYINKIKMVDNYLLGFSMKNQIANEFKKDIDTQIQNIKLDILNSKEFIMKETILDKFATKQMVKSKKMKEHSNTGIKKIITVEDSCIQCKTCVKVCPVGNISLSGNKIELDNKCFMCFACVQNCPVNAIHLRGERDRSRYRNKHVSIREIITSNTQI